MNSVTQHHLKRGLLTTAILIIAFNLRPGLAAVGPVVDFIRVDTGLSNALIGFLTTLPLLAFGVISMFTALFTNRWGIEMTMTVALALLAVGTFLRIIPGAAALFGGTLLLGIGIAFGNVILPGIIKRDFPDRSGIMTSLYSGILGIGTMIAAGISFPIAASLGWRWSLGVWTLPALLAVFAWLPRLRSRTRPDHSQNFLQSVKRLGKTSLAWQVALFMGLQSLSFYVILAWLPEILQSVGMSSSKAGWILSFTEGMGALGSLIIPALAEKLKRLHHLIWILMMMEMIGLIGLIFSSGSGLDILWSLMIGFVLGGSFGLALLLFVLRTSDPETATGLSGMAQSIGYLLAAVGPVVFGWLHDSLHSWTIPLVILLVVLLGKLIAGLGAARPRQVGEG